MPVSDSTWCVRAGRQRLPSQASAKPAKLPRLPSEPTARHRAGPAHARPAIWVSPPLGLGMGSWVQLVPPFQRSANNEVPSPPTTMQLAGEVHQRPSKGRNVCGAGMVSTDHVLPSQTSTDGLTANPAAMHAVALVQDTAPKAWGPFWGSVVASRVQVLPSHDSASV